MKFVEFEPKALEEYAQWAHDNTKIFDKINDLIKDIQRNGASKGIGKPEKLKYRDGWSRRITKEHRIAYDVDDEDITIYSCKGHYE